MGKNEIPDRWLPYSPMGSVIPGTRFIACKVPLKDALLRSVPEKERFGPKNLLEAFPKIGLLIDLTNTTRYYFKQDFTDKNIQYEKIFCPGKVVPPNSIVNQFFKVVDDYLASESDPDTVIVVHCTHGVNRTGYFICRYMIERLNMSPEEALTNFELARGHNIERDTYVSDLKNGCRGGNEADLRMISDRGFQGGGNWQNHKKRDFRSTGFSRHDDNTEKRGRYQHSDDQSNGQWRNNRHRPKDMHNFNRRQHREDKSLSYNWRDREMKPNSIPPHPVDNSVPLTTPLPQFTPAYPQEEIARPPYDTPHHMRFQDGRHKEGRNFVGSSNDGHRGSYHKGFNQKFRHTNETYDTTSRLVEGSAGQFQPRHDTRGTWHEGGHRGRISRGGGRGGGGGGYRGRGRGNRGGPRSWSRGNGSQRNEYSR